MVTEQRGKKKIILLSNCRIINIHWIHEPRDVFMVPNRGVFTHGGRPEDGGFEFEVVRRRKIKSATRRGGGGDERNIDSTKKIGFEKIIIRSTQQHQTLIR